MISAVRHKARVSKYTFQLNDEKETEGTAGGEGGGRQKDLLQVFFPVRHLFLPVENARKKQANLNGHLLVWFQTL